MLSFTDKEMPNADIKELKVSVSRFDPEKDTKPYLKEYRVPVTTGMTVLEVLFYIKEHLDGSLTFRSSCRMGVCGSCGMMINKAPHLACHTQVFHVSTEELVIEPLPNYNIIRDLVCDLTPLFEKHKSIKPFIIRHKDSLDKPEGEQLQKPKELNKFLQFSYCLKCGMCMAACPTVATDKDFLGPQSLGQAYRYIADSRDCDYLQRIDVIDTPHGAWRCHFAGACSQACPNGVDPAMAIQLLKKHVTSNALGFDTQDEQAVTASLVTGAERNPKIPYAPEPTIKPKKTNKSKS